ncbi:MAG: hypothetical protein Q8P20_06995 [bacterium]|nr:hypothetical protein [bacterium]
MIEQDKKQQKLSNNKALLIIIGLLLGILITLLVLFSANMLRDNFDDEFGLDSFEWKNNLSCKINISTNPSHVGGKITITELDSKEPKLVIGQEEYTFVDKFENYYEDEDMIKIRYIQTNEISSTDEMVINKKTGAFARAGVGEAMGVYSFAQKGICK